MRLSLTALEALKTTFYTYVSTGTATRALQKHGIWYTILGCIPKRSHLNANTVANDSHRRVILEGIFKLMKLVQWSLAKHSLEKSAANDTQTSII